MALGFLIDSPDKLESSIDEAFAYHGPDSLKLESHL